MAEPERTGLVLISPTDGRGLLQATERPRAKFVFTSRDVLGELPQRGDLVAFRLDNGQARDVKRLGARYEGF